MDVTDLLGAVAKRLARSDEAVAGDGSSMSGVNGPLEIDPVRADVVQIINRHLGVAQRTGSFDQLILVAPHQLLNALLNHLDRRLRASLALALEADLVEADAAVIRAGLPL